MSLNEVEVREARAFLDALEKEDDALREKVQAERQYLSLSKKLPPEDLPGLPVSVAPRVQFLRGLLNGYSDFEAEKVQLQGKRARQEAEIADLKQQLSEKEAKHQASIKKVRAALTFMIDDQSVIEHAAGHSLQPEHRPQWDSSQVNGGQGIGR